MCKKQDKRRVECSNCYQPITVAPGEIALCSECSSDEEVLDDWEAGNYFAEEAEGEL